MIEAAIFSVLAADPGVSGVVASRIYPVLMPEGVAYPALSYFVVDADEIHTLDRTSGLVHKRLQVDAWGNSYSDVKTLQALVRTALEATFGNYGGVNINGIMRDNEHDLYEKETRTYHCAQDFLLLYNE